MRDLVRFAILMQDPETTTTTTTAAPTFTVYYDGFAACAGETVSFDISGYDSCSGTSCSGVVNNVAVGTLLTASNTNGPKASGPCTTVQACVSSGYSGQCNLVSDTQTGIAVTASVSYTITSGSPSVIYLSAGLIA